jgi:hypothetical protein
VSARAAQCLSHLGLDGDGRQGIETQPRVEGHPQLGFDSVASQLFLELEFRFSAGCRLVEKRACQGAAHGQSEN